ncbi:putative LRR receptor-like serine/threonine-protein kinase [Platanthera guangdongensis]|uniref:LRR receptor-like serine/threonine-protein kinase n=1 Tax=Platanthera guangdongensis TaxID=2320717 RepID=A0ABR2LNR7_9ASPA
MDWNLRRRHRILRIVNATEFLLFPFLLLRVLAAAAAAVVGETEMLLQFKGNVTADPRVTCGDAGFVEKIRIHGADLEGTLSSSIAGLRDLQILSLFGNRFSGVVPVEYAGIRTLRKLNLSRNGLSGEVPAFLGDLPSLRLLDLAGNSFSGEIPDSLFNHCLRTKFVSLSHNRLSGPIPTSIANCFKLIGFNFSFNDLTGGFPPEICALPAISFVALGNNSLFGTIVDKISACRSLEYLDLSSNTFSGALPFNLLSLTNLSYFNTSFNRLQGFMPEIKICSDRLMYIDVSGNDLGGLITPSIANCKALKYLDMGFNRFSGNIPAEIRSIKSLSVLRLSSNAITGEIPPELGELELLQILHLHNLQLSGQIPLPLCHCQFLLDLDASRNKLQGEIPSSLNNMTSLQRLDLHHNKLAGTIPSTLGQLTWLQLLDLSDNSLAGAIPLSLGNLTLLSHFNLSFNNLSGPIPSSPAIQRFGYSAFANNPLLCGSPLNILCIESRRKEALTITIIIAITAASLIFAGLCLITAMNVRASRKKNLEDEKKHVSESTSVASTDSRTIVGKLVLFGKNLPSKYEDWESGTNALLDKDCLIGGGSIGSVYKTYLDGGRITIAVKKLETLGRIKNQDEFEQEMSSLGRIEHPNLAIFHGYYWSHQLQLILSEFVPNESLHHHLHDSSFSGGRRTHLLWARRFKIAVGTARALAFLHHDCKPQILHLNVKSTNIMLGEEQEAKLCDYGLMKMLPILGSNGPADFRSAAGYAPPELASHSLRYSEKSDVYSFGVVLLEIRNGEEARWRS